VFRLKLRGRPATSADRSLGAQDRAWLQLRLRFMSLIVVLVAGLVSGVTAQPASAEPAGCAGPEGYGPWKATQANFSQRVGLNTCADPFQLGARIEFSPGSGFAYNHVQGCAVHWRLIMDSPDHIEFPEIVRSCTNALQTASFRSMNTATTWKIPSQYFYPRLHVNGYINIQAVSGYYNTWAYRSPYFFSHCLSPGNCA
jgi:hypothetical protein